MNKKLLLMLVLLFAITQALGLFVAKELIAQDVHATIVNDNPNDAINTIALVAYILVFTAVLLVVAKLKKKFSFVFLKLFEILAIFGASTILFGVFFGDLIGLSAALVLVCLRIVFQDNVPIRNLASVAAIVGAGALLGVSLGIIPVIVFVAALSVYDFIAVFKTKHMVSLAKAVVEKNLAFTVALPTKEHKFELGTGDLVIPLVFASAVLQNSSVNAAILVLAGSLIGLILTVDYSSKNIGKALPALPLQGIFMILLFGVSKLLGF